MFVPRASDCSQAIVRRSDDSKHLMKKGNNGNQIELTHAMVTKGNGLHNMASKANRPSMHAAYYQMRAIG